MMLCYGVLCSVMLCYVILCYVRDRQNAGSCELYYRWNSITCIGKRYLLPKTIPPIAMVKFATATVFKLPFSINPAGRRRRPFQYSSCTSRERKSSRPPETTIPVLKLYEQRMKIQPAAGDGRSSTKVVLTENENSAGRRRRPFQY